MTQIFSASVDAPSLRSGIWINPVVHELFESLRLVGMRDRLRCPHCRSVGTWKPHGGSWDRRHGDTRAVRRWMCKCCGLYQGPEGTTWAFPNVDKGYWDLPAEVGLTLPPTPQKILRSAKVWPWHG